MATALLAAAILLAAPAHAAVVRPLPHEAFLSASKMYGGAEDPLDTLAAAGEDLRDALASPPGVSGLQAGLRAPRADDRLLAIRAAARPREVSGIPYLAAALLRLDQPASVRAAAALALGRINDRVAVPALAEALKDPAPDVRYAAALALGRLPADGVATRLERVLKTDPSWQVRYAAAIALGRTRKGFAAQSLSEALSGDDSWQVRQQAARSLQELPSERSVSALASALRDPEPSVRAAAGTALAEIGGPTQRREIADALALETEPSVKAVLSVAARRALKN